MLRPYSGIAGDIMVAGLAGLLDADQKLLDDLTAAIGIKELGPGSFSLEKRMVNAVSGLGGAVSLPHEHAHRSFTDIRALIQAGAMAPEAKELAVEAFRIIAEAEGAVHAKDAASVTFHEVGALDSILDICLAASLFVTLAPVRFICGPLPVCDGVIRCAHGEIPSPAPAVLRMLHGVPVTGFAASGETVTPTGIALLKAFSAEFGPWPAMVLERETIAYGTKVFANVPNGALFAFGNAL
ncbi:LarC family nickel insertion protein [Desulfovibrio sp. OttesenSCG-928-I05]|nr:LarC family nickel insertion protein [Desulfovibrio sp. OttesenSCG-928-I05]